LCRMPFKPDFLTYSSFCRFLTEIQALKGFQNLLSTE